MIGRSTMLVVCAMVAALVTVAVIGLRVLERDRAAMHARFAQDRMHGLEESARSLTSDTHEIAEDLDLAATLLEDAESREVAERELHAIATIKREYMVVEARSRDAATTRVVALDAPPGIVDQVDRQLIRALDSARETPGELYVSTVLEASQGRSTWYRVFARQHRDRRHAVAVVVDTTILLGRLKLVRERDSAVLVLGSQRTVAPTSDPRLAAMVETDPKLQEIVARTAAGRTGSTKLDGDQAAALELPRTTAIAVAVPLQVDRGTPWTLLLVSSTAALEAQEQTLVRRVLVLGCLVLVLLLGAAAYVTHNARRAATLRERLRHVDRLAHLTEKAEKIVDHIPSGVLTLSDDRRITSANRWFKERLADDIVGRPLEAAFADAPAAQIAMLAKLIDEAARTGAARSRYRERLELLGTETQFSIHAIPLAHNLGDVNMLLVFDDLTEQRRIEERLLHSEKLVTAGQLAAGIAHEVGTPLNIARGRAELLKARSAQPDEANHQVIIDQIDRVTRLIHQLLDFVRPSATRIQAVDIAATMQATTELLAPEAGKRKVQLRTEVVGNVAVLRSDPDRLQQVLVNLVMNGIDACTDGGNVALRARDDASMLVIEVTDDGHGVPYDLQAQIFDPFFTTKKRGQGTGLGLWVVAQLVRAHDGEIELDSVPGSGTTVRIKWPRV